MAITKPKIPNQCKAENYLFIDILYVRVHGGGGMDSYTLSCCVQMVYGQNQRTSAYNCSQIGCFILYIKAHSHLYYANTTMRIIFRVDNIY